ncbi:MAG: DUF2946 family protein [Burkholderiales bacterium]
MPLDDLVRQAMARWPNVPAVHGWLRLDRRGRWMLVDRGAPGFDAARDGAGSEITSPPIVDFIGRNYGDDGAGRWHWQNGPQRVFVDLDLAPLYLRVLGDAPTQTLVTHTGWPAEHIERAAVDDAGNLWLVTEHGAGVVDDRDLGALDLDLDEAPPPGAAAGTLRLLGRHDVARLDEPPPAAFGFQTRPRDAGGAD